jgi:hypothetical protein
MREFSPMILREIAVKRSLVLASAFIDQILEVNLNPVRSEE